MIAQQSIFKNESGTFFIQADYLPEKTDVKLILWINHGWGEHSGCYDSFVQYLLQEQLCHVIRWDMRGHGRSSGLRGWSPSWPQLIQDWMDVFDYTRHHLPEFLKQKCLWVFWGHSLGGLLVLKALYDRLFDPIGIILSNPFLGLSKKPPLWKQFLASALRSVSIPVTVPMGIDPLELSDDPQWLENWKKDHLRHGLISAPVYWGSLSVQKMLKPEKMEYSLPCLWLASQRDPIVSYPDQETFFQSWPNPNKTLLVYDLSIHELIQSRMRTSIYEDIKQWWQSSLLPFLRKLNLVESC